MREITRYVGIKTGIVFSMSKQNKNLISCFLDRCHKFKRKNGKQCNIKSGSFSNIYQKINLKQLN